jgi:hypothetical protein
MGLEQHRSPPSIRCPSCLGILDQDPNWLPQPGFSPDLRLFRHLKLNHPCPYQVFVQTKAREPIGPSMPG